MTSGYVRQEDQDAALNMGVRAFILKPDTIEELGGVLQRLLAPDAGA
jgi:CheY-like chemotaxis protein